jgi:hypothetical protein
MTRYNELTEEERARVKQAFEDVCAGHEFTPKERADLATLLGMPSDSAEPREAGVT